MRFFVTCAKGTEGALRRELVALRAHAPRGDTGGVSFDGVFDDGMKVCLWSRAAVRVLLEVGAFRASDAAELYDGARRADWAPFVTPTTTIAVSASVSDSPTLRHSGFAALKVKDAVVDAVRDRLGARPNVSVDDPDVSLFLHVRGADARLYVDMAGEALHRRGHRVAMTDAPLKETLAAAVLALGGVALDRPFIDPMAGSGTLAIEHALAARRIAPGIGRRFGFERWPDQSRRGIWESFKRQAKEQELPAASAPIVARDISPDAITAARRNAAAAGVAADIRFETGDIALPLPREPAGTLVLNPPYGERLLALPALYDRIAQALGAMTGWRVVVLVGNPVLTAALTRAAGRKPEVTHRLWNGPIEVRLLRYQM